MVSRVCLVQKVPFHVEDPVVGNIDFRIQSGSKDQSGQNKPKKKKRRKKAEEKITKEKKVTRDFCETSTLIQLHFDSENEIRSKAR